jgi:hypoxanthine phosphoribosyltransferase
METHEHTAFVRPLFSRETIRKRVAEIGSSISADFREITEENPLCLVVVLKGAFIFAADLVRYIRVPCTIDFLSASSYGKEMISSGDVTIRHALSVQSRHVLLIEDIVDTGLTIQRISALLSAQSPASLGICTLLDKPSERKHPVRIAYSGFTVPDRFIVGYGIDHAERFRQLPFIGILDS